MSTSTEPGRGRKQCPGCNLYIGVRSAKCTCGHVFNPETAAKQDTPAEPREIKTFTEAGPGRKQCPACNVFIGVRSNVCVCGHEFVKKVKDNKESTPVVKEEKPKIALVSRRKGEPVPSTTPSSPTTLRPSSSYDRIERLIPAGPCPYKMDALSEDGLREWIHNVRSTAPKGIYYGHTALSYWISHSFAPHNPVWRLAQDMLLRIMQEEIAFTRDSLSKELNKEVETEVVNDTQSTD